MAFYNFKSADLKLNNNEILCSDIILSTRAATTPNYYVNQRHSFDRAPAGGIDGSLSFTYTLTGVDVVKNYVMNDTPISGNFAGISFNSGYLSKYSFNVNPFGPITVNANINFFESLDGTFNPKPHNPTGSYLINATDASIYLYNGYSEESISNITNFSYNYTSEVNPVYVVNYVSGLQNVSPYKVTFGKKYIETSLVCDNLVSNLPIYGKNMGIKFTTRHPYLPNYYEEYICSGIMESKTISVSASEDVKKEIKITQYNIDPTPNINRLDKESGIAGELVSIYGSGLTNTTEVYFADTQTKDFTITSDSLVTAYVPLNAISGKLKITTYGGNYTYTTTGFDIVNGPYGVKTFSPYTGRAFDTIQISGSGFYRVDTVFFSGLNNEKQTGKFRRINSDVIEVTVPTGATYGKISVGSSLRKYTGVSVYEYAPIPLLTGYTPMSGVSGSAITLLGWNFSGISGITFNGVYSTGFNVKSNSEIITYVPPSGEWKGYIRLSGFSGVLGYSQTVFNPVIYITGVDPISGRVGSVVKISGKFFHSGLMSNFDSGTYKVKFGNYMTGFYTSGDQLLTGRVPTGVTPGTYQIISVMQKDGVSTYYSNQRFRIRWDDPRVDAINGGFIAPGVSWGRQLVSGTSGGFLIFGANLADLSGVSLKGIVPENLGDTLVINTPYLTGDLYGKMAKVTGNFFTGEPGRRFRTGLYELKITTYEGVAYSTGTQNGYQFTPSGLLVVKNNIVQL